MKTKAIVVQLTILVLLCSSFRGHSQDSTVLKVFYEFFPDKTHSDILHEGTYHAFEKFKAGF